MSFFPGFMKDAMMGGNTGAKAAPPQSLESVVEQLDNTELSGTGQAKVFSDLQKLASSDPQLKSEVGLRAVDRVMDVLTTAPLDAEAARSGLSLLTELIKDSESAGARHAFNHSPGMMNAGLIAEDETNVHTLLDLVAAEDFYVRFHSVRLLGALLGVKPTAVQGAIMSAPLGIARIMDSVDDARELLRNEALLLLVELTKANQEVQKVVAFESAFERLLTILGNEGYARGGVVAQDVLSVLFNLLDGNVSNQTFFRETSCLQYLVPLLEVDPSEMRGLSDQECTNIVLGLKLMSCLMVGGSPSAVANRSAAMALGFLPLMWTLSAERVRSPQLRAQALCSVGDLIRTNKDGQDAFMTFTVPKGNYSIHADPALSKRSSLLHLVSVVMDSAFYTERASAAYVLLAYMDGNPDGQVAMASTLTPSPEALQGPDPAGTIHSVGRLLVTSLLSLGKGAQVYTEGGEAADSSSALAGKSRGGAFLEGMNKALGAMPPDLGPGSAMGPSLSAWFSGLILSRMLHDNAECKELVLKLPLELTVVSSEPISLLPQVLEALIAAVHADGSDDAETLRPQVALLNLLNYWVNQCPSVVSAILAGPANVPFLVESIILPSAPTLRRGLSALLLGQCMLYCPAAAAAAGDAAGLPAGPADDEHGLDGQALLQLIRHRIGVDVFTSALDKLAKSGPFSTAEQANSILALAMDDDQVRSLLYFDHEFTALFKRVSADLISTLRSGSLKATPDRAGANSADARALAQARHQVASLQNANARLKAENARLAQELDQAAAAAAAAQQAAQHTTAPQTAAPASLDILADLERENLELKDKIHDLNAKLMSSKTGIAQVDPRELERLKVENASLRREVQELAKAPPAPATEPAAEPATEPAAPNSEMDDLLVFLGEMEVQVTAFKALLDDHGISYDHLLPDDGSEYEYSTDDDEG